jgi:hypothetical protein
MLKQACRSSTIIVLLLLSTIILQAQTPGTGTVTLAGAVRFV